ncbi:MAG: hypothetical protein A4E61_01027 [Syntrophorhabdus sp. PtaB.Bin184]|nr:MAG: hypothetical protein A4E61_01027 [Syntrophorhabdus sp. PtaB.Bin184]
MKKVSAAILVVLMVLWAHAGIANAESAASAPDVGKIQKLREAIDGSERTLRQNPQDKEAIKLLSESCERMDKENAHDLETVKLMAIAYHSLASAKIKGTTKKAIAYLEKARELSPDDMELLAYLGSAMTMSARDSWNVVAKLSRVNKGINMLDTAVARAPSNIALRMIRGSNSMALPGMFNRKDVALKDFLFVEEMLGKKPEWNDHDKTLASSVFYRLGMIYKGKSEEQQGKSYFERAVKTAPGSFWSSLAKKELSAES